LDSKTGQKKWRYDTGGPVLNLTTAGQTIFINPKRTGRILAVHGNTGQIKWETDVGETIRGRLIIENGTLYFNCLDDFLYAVDQETGKKIRRIPITGRPFYAIDIVEGTAFFGTQIGDQSSAPNYLVAVNIRTGSERWRMRTSGTVNSGWAVDRGIAHFACDGGQLYAVNLETGKVVWTAKLEPDDPAYIEIAEGIVYTSIGENLLAHDRNTGRQLWRVNVRDMIPTGITAANSCLFWGTEDGFLCCAEGKTGLPVWKIRLQEDTRVVVQAFQENILYVGTLDLRDEVGHLYAIEVGSCGHAATLLDRYHDSRLSWFSSAILSGEPNPIGWYPLIDLGSSMN